MSIGSFTRIRTNLQAQLSLQNLQSTNRIVGGIQEKLSTGKRINRAEDDSAGYSIAAKLRARVRGQDQAFRNVGDAKSMLTVAEGGLNTILDMLVEMKEKVIQGANDSNGPQERKAIRTELKALTREVQQTLDETTFNGNNLFTDDPAGTDLTFQVNAEAGDTFDVNIDRLSSRSLTLTSSAATSRIVGADLMLDDNLAAGDLAFGSAASAGLEAEFEIETTDVSVAANGNTYNVDFQVTTSASTNGGTFSNTTTKSLALSAAADTLRLVTGASLGLTNDLTLTVGDLTSNIEQGDRIYVSVDDIQLNARNAQIAEGALGVIDDAISGVSKAVSNLGDAQNRMSFKLDNLKTAKINNEAARSQIEDADFAFQQVQLAKQQILQQSGTSALAQANAAPQSVLSLFGG
jgi:flagellin